MLGLVGNGILTYQGPRYHLGLEAAIAGGLWPHHSPRVSRLKMLRKLDWQLTPHFTKCRERALSLPKRPAAIGNSPSVLESQLVLFSEPINLPSSIFRANPGHVKPPVPLCSSLSFWSEGPAGAGGV